MLCVTCAVYGVCTSIQAVQRQYKLFWASQTTNTKNTQLSKTHVDRNARVLHTHSHTCYTCTCTCITENMESITHTCTFILL